MAGAAVRARNCFLIAGVLMMITGGVSMAIAPSHMIGPIYIAYGGVFLFGAFLAQIDRGWYYHELGPANRPGYVRVKETKYQVCGCF